MKPVCVTREEIADASAQLSQVMQERVTSTEYLYCGVGRDFVVRAREK